MEKIHEGWLTKSPPEWKKHMRLFKLKWRRRYFVLYSPPSSCVTPGTCPAQLCYYESETLSKECGKIDLTSCEEVVTQLETDDHDHVMALRTVCKNQTRIYYLAADCEKELEIWVERISFVLSLSGEEFLESNTAFDEEEENHVPSNLKSSKKLKSSNSSKSKKDKQIRCKAVGVTLIRSSSLLSKSSTCLTQLTSRQNRQAGFATSGGLSLSTSKRVSRFVSPTILESTAVNSHDSSDSDASSLTSHSSSLFSKHSFLSKIKPTVVKASNPRRPSCPILIPSSGHFEEASVSAELDVLRQKIQKSNQPVRFQGSSGSSILSYASDYRTPDLNSPSIHMTPPILLPPVKKLDTPDCNLSKAVLKSESVTPPPLPPKKKSSDSEPIADQIGPLPSRSHMPSMIYDVPAHNYGGYESEEEHLSCLPPKACMSARSLEDVECFNRYEGVCLSVVDEQDDEGPDCDLSTPTQYCRRTNTPCDDYTLLPNSIPPPLPMRNTARKSDGDIIVVDDNWRSSNDSSYDVLPYARKNVTTSETLASASRDDTDSDNNDDDDSYDYIPMDNFRTVELPPPIPRRTRRFSSDIAVDAYMGRSDLEDSLENLYDHIGGKNFEDDFSNSEKRNELLDEIKISLEQVETKISEELKQTDSASLDEDVYKIGPSSIEKAQLSQFQVCWDSESEHFAKKLLMRKKSKSLEDITATRGCHSEWGPKDDSLGVGDEEEDDALIRKTFKTKSFKRKSADYKRINQFDELDKDSSNSSLTSTSSVAYEEEPKTFIVCDDALY